MLPAVERTELLPARYTKGVFSPASLALLSAKNVSIELLSASERPIVLVILPTSVIHSLRRVSSSGLTTTALIPRLSSVSAAFFNFIGRNTTSGEAATQASVLNSLAVPILGRLMMDGAASL